MCLFKLEWPYLFWVVVIFLYLVMLVMVPLGSQQPPSHFLPRLLFLIAVAVLVERRGGRPSNVKYTGSLFYEIIVTFLVGQLALVLVWNQIEKIIHAVLTFTAAGVEAVMGMTLTCDTCFGIDNMEHVITTLIAALLLFWVIYSVMTLSVLQRCMCPGARTKDNNRVRFWARVEVRSINPGNHNTVNPTDEELHAPKDEGTNPIVHPESSGFGLVVDS